MGCVNLETQMDCIKRSKNPKNKYLILDDTTTILYCYKNGKRLETYIDTNKLEFVKQFTWCIMGQSKKQQGYVGFSRKRKSEKTIYYKLHRMLMGVTDSNIWIDHENRNRFDNRIVNLRIADSTTNSYNTKKLNQNATSKYKGVVYRQNRRRYESSIQVNGDWIYLGTFLTELEAVKVYDQAAERFHGEFSCTNVKLGLITQEELSGIIVDYTFVDKHCKAKSKFRGVSTNTKSKKKPWRAFTNSNGRQVSLGYFKTEEEAARAYNEKAKELFGDKARLNAI